MHELRRSITTRTQERSDRIRRVTKFVQVALVTVGGLVAAVSGLFTTGLVWTPGSVAAAIALVIAFIGSVFLILTQDNTDNLDKAMEAIGKAEECQQAAISLNQENSYLEYMHQKMTSLYLTYNSARGAIEQLAVSGPKDEVSVLQTILDVVRTDLRIALGFQMEQIWTIAIYKREVGQDGATYLRAAAIDRSMTCDVSKARLWREGIGVGGMAFARNDEVAAPDILDPAAKSLFSLGNGVLQPEDHVRYRSLFSVPVNVGNDKRPWGVVLASSSEPGHFSAPDGARGAGGGLNNEEALRALAGIVALAVAVCRQHTGDAEECSSPCDAGGE